MKLKRNIKKFVTRKQEPSGKVRRLEPQTHLGAKSGFQDYGHTQYPITVTFWKPAKAGFENSKIIILIATKQQNAQYHTIPEEEEKSEDKNIKKKSWCCTKSESLEYFSGKVNLLTHLVY